ncbi:MAG: hypothetical protein OXC80_03475 [Gammaproteobacteria bacterium]|nr:hypothetical protein [Gammaproteobacteria bacterium]
MSDFLSKISPNAPLTSEQQKVLERALHKTMTRYKALEENRDGRGLNSIVQGNIDRTYKHFLEAINLGLNHQDPLIRKEARKLMRDPSNIEPRKLIERASRFSSLLKKRSRFLDDLAKSTNARSIQLPGAIELHEIKDATTLQYIGKMLALHVKSTDSARHLVEDRSMEVWEIRSLENSIGLIQVNISKPNVRKISSFNGAEEEPLFLNPPDLFQIILNLNVNNTDHPVFLKSGCLPMFKDLEIRNLVPEPVIIGRDCFYVWRTEGALAVASKPDGVDDLNLDTRTKFAWSYFTQGVPQPRTGRPLGRDPRRIQLNQTHSDPSVKPLWIEYRYNSIGFPDLFCYLENEDFYRACRNIISSSDQNQD